MHLGEEFNVIGDWFRLHFTENIGMAFGLKLGGTIGKAILSNFRIIALFFIGWYLVRIIRKNAGMGLVASMSLIFAGALGNIIDSVLYGPIFSESTRIQIAEFLPEGGGYATLLQGAVVDMLYFPIASGYLPDWMGFGDRYFVFFRPVFNIADASITTGVLLILVFQRKFFKKGSAGADVLGSDRTVKDKNSEQSKVDNADVQKEDSNSVEDTDEKKTITEDVKKETPAPDNNSNKFKSNPD